jgi:hypothetical protein
MIYKCRSCGKAMDPKMVGYFCDSCRREGQRRYARATGGCVPWVILLPLLLVLLGALRNRARRDKRETL